MALLDQDEELLAKLREETAGRSDIELPPSDLTPQAVPQMQPALPGEAPEAPTPSVAEIIKQDMAKQTAQQKPSRLEQLASAIKGGGEAVGEGLGKVGAGIGKAFGGGAPAEDDGYNRVGHALYAAATKQTLPADFFKRGKPEDKEMLGLEKDLRRAQILKALRGEPVKPVDPADDFKSPISLAAQDVMLDRLKDSKLSPEEFARAEKLIRMQSANQLKGSTPLGTQIIGDYYRGKAADDRAVNITLAQGREDRNDRKFTHEQFTGFNKDVDDFNKTFDKNNMQLQIDAAREADKLLGGALSASDDVPLPSKVDAFDLPHKVDARLKFLPSLALKKLQGEYEAEKARNPNAKTEDITKKLMARPEYAREIEQLQISSSIIDNILTNKLYGSALSEQEAGRARAMLGTEWGQTPAGRVYALRLVTRAMDKALKRQSGKLKVYADQTGMNEIYNNYVSNGAIIEGVWDAKPQPAAQEEKPRTSPLDRPSNPSDKGPQVAVPEGMPEVTTQVSEPTPDQLANMASGNKKQTIRVPPKKEPRRERKNHAKLGPGWYYPETGEFEADNG